MAALMPSGCRSSRPVGGGEEPGPPSFVARSHRGTVGPGAGADPPRRNSWNPQPILRWPRHDLGGMGLPRMPIPEKEEAR